MEQDEYIFRTGRFASRPPEGGDDPDSSASLFTELPISPTRRTPNSGRPDYGSARPQAQSGGRTRQPLYNTQGYGAYSDAERRRSQAAPRDEATFTELSWDSLRSGNFDPPAPPAPTADPYDPMEAEDYRRYTQPARRMSPSNYNASTRKAPAYRNYDRNAPQRPAAHASANRPYDGGTTPPPRYNPPGGGSRPPRRPKKRGLHPIFYVIALLLVVLLIVGIRAIVKGISESSRTPKTTPVMYVPGSAVTPAPATPTPDPNATHTPEPTPEATPTPTPVPTPTPSGPKAKRSGDLIVPASWGPAVPERFHAQYDSHFDKTCMIGNSLVEGFFMWSGMNNIRYIYDTGAVVTNVVGVMDLGPVALNPDYYTDIYLMFGLNEVGTSVNSFVDGYKKVVDFIRGYQPHANIYLISVTPVTRTVDEDPNEVQSMERINNFNAALKEFCVDNDCWYLDIYSMLLDREGYLSDEFAFEGDGKHFEKSGYVAWANYMKTHYVDEGLLSE